MKNQYCVVLLVPNTEMQLCGDAGTHPLTLVEAIEQACRLASMYYVPDQIYSVTFWEHYCVLNPRKEFSKFDAIMDRWRKDHATQVHSNNPKVD